MAGHEYLRVHRVVAEQKIGRALKKGEIVHHIDGNKHNNSPENLEVMTQGQHARLHHTGVKKEPKMICKKGHPLSGENLHLTSSGGRTCKICVRAYARWWKREERLERGLKKPGPKKGTPGAMRISESNKRRAKSREDHKSAS